MADETPVLASHDGPAAVAHFEDINGKPLPSQRGSVVISAEGIHSVLRKQLYPNEGPPKYSGINMWSDECGIG